VAVEEKLHVTFSSGARGLVIQTYDKCGGVNGFQSSGIAEIKLEFLAELRETIKLA
jgi:hypothetical protein